MIIWSIIWSIMLISLILLVLMEIINGTIELRFWICLILVFALILIPIFTLGAYNQSKLFVNKYASFAEKVSTMSDSQEYMYIGNAIDYNYQLSIYQKKIHQLGIFAPYCKEIKEMKPIQMRNFDLSNYILWG